GRLARRSRLRVMLDHRGDREEQLALRVEKVTLRVRGDEVAERCAENAARVVDEPRGTRAICVAHGFESEKVTESRPSSSRPRVTRLPLSTRGSEISRL